MPTLLTPPNGFTPRALTSWNRYYIPQSDSNAYRVGDAVKSAGGTDASGIIAVTLHLGTGPARGVIVAVDPGLPATGGLTNGQKLSVPASKLTGYYVWVDDDPSHQFAMVDDGLNPANSVAAAAGKFANFTPGAAPAQNGGSTAAITSSTLGATSGCLQILSLQPGSSYGSAATWLVKFAVHELANGAAAGGGGGITTLSSATDYNSNLVTPLNSKLNLSLGWNGTTPALASGTNPITAGFGSNSFVYTGGGTSPALDGATGVNGDVFIFGVGGSSTWSVTPKHDPSAVQTSQIGSANGVAGLDSGGKVPVAQLPAAVTGSLNYQGTYNASTNTPAIVAGNKGFYWKVSVAGTSLGYTWSVGDDVVDNGTTIDQIDGSGLSATVAGNTTAIAANTAALTVQTDNSQTGTTYTFVLADAGQNVDLSNAAAITATIPPHSSVPYPVGTLLYYTQVGAGLVTIAPGAGVTFTKPTNRSLTTSAQLEGGYAYQWSLDNWRVYNA